MTALKHDMKRVQELTFEAYKASGGVMALIDGQDPDPGRLSSALDNLSAQLEGGALELRTLCETHQPRLRERPGKPGLPALDLAGSAEVNEYGWLHITLNTLLPNCRFRTPAWLTDTVVRLLDRCEHRYGALPMFDRALLIIDEHCDLNSRQVFDQDNKAWKAIPNALKGRLIRDDDQFTLGVCLLSTWSREACCHVHLLPQRDAGDFFFLHGEDYPCR